MTLSYTRPSHLVPDTQRQEAQAGQLGTLRAEHPKPDTDLRVREIFKATHRKPTSNQLTEPSAEYLTFIRRLLYCLSAKSPWKAERGHFPETRASINLTQNKESTKIAHTQKGKNKSDSTDKQIQ